MATNKEILLKAISVVILIATGITLIGIQNKPLGWILLAVGIALLKFCEREFAKDMLLIYISLIFLGITPITTDVSVMHMLVMCGNLTLAILVPVLISRYIYRKNTIKFKWNHDRKWFSHEVFYILFTLVVSYFLLPFYLKNSGAYLNWTVEGGFSFISRLFIGTNGLGIWDELFFICIVLGILRNHMDFKYANIVQAILFTSFLYELGFTGWGPLMIFPFALTQGYIFKKTDSLLYIITIHLTIDLILFLALINAHHPSWMPIFLS